MVLVVDEFGATIIRLDSGKSYDIVSFYFMSFRDLSECHLGATGIPAFGMVLKDGFYLLALLRTTPSVFV